MAANLVEKFQEAIKACEEISVKQLNAQKQEIAKQFEELRKVVYEIVDEKTIILANLNWKRAEKIVAAPFYEVLKAEAKRISMIYGYPAETIFEILNTKNAFDHTEVVKEAHLLWDTTYKYQYWTLE